MLEPFLIYLAPYKTEKYYTDFRSKFEGVMREGNIDPSSSFQKQVKQLSSEADVSSCKNLVYQLGKKLIWLGGKTKCYTIEKKTRVFIDEILQHVCEQISGPRHLLFEENESDTNDVEDLLTECPVYTDMEIELKMFGEIIKPDYALMRLS